MSTKEAARDRIRAANALLQAAQAEAKAQQDAFAEVCRDVYDNEGLNDREIAEITGYSRARIQQFRCGDPRKKAKK